MSTASAPAARDESLRKALVRYAAPELRRSVWNVLTSLVPYVALIAAMVLVLRVSTVLALVLAVPAAGFLIRTFIVFHDCAHGAFFRSKRANELLGAMLGVVVYMPFASWRHEHAVHHATSGDLDHRGVGDIHTLTVAEYRAQPWWGRLGYRLFRNPVVMFGLGPLLVVGLKPRVVTRSMRPKIRRSVLGTNLALAAVIAALCWLLGWQTFLLVQLPVQFIAGAAGIWLFYVQHQFESTYWQTNDQWSYTDAALKGSSYLRLPRILQFFTGNIGLHHVHHLIARIPNYNLQAAHDGSPDLQSVPTLSVMDGLRAVRLKLWDEEQGRLVTFREARARDAAHPVGVALGATE